MAPEFSARRRAASQQCERTGGEGLVVSFRRIQVFNPVKGGPKGFLALSIVCLNDEILKHDATDDMDNIWISIQRSYQAIH